MEWRTDFENAPKDGQLILLYGDHGASKHGPTVGWYWGGLFPWAFIDDVYTTFECRACGNMDGEAVTPNAFSKEHPPTHWALLPEPPDGDPA